MKGVLLLFAALFATSYAAPLSTSASVPPVHSAKRIALSFDDVPRGPGAFMTPDERGARIIAELKRTQVEQVAFFLNPARVNHGDGDADRIARYVAAGHVIANHTFTHPHLSTTSAEAYLADIDAAEAWLKDRPGRRPWFRFPFLDEGGKDKAKRDAIRAGLKARGLQNGYVTVDGSDWYIEQLTVEAKKAGKPIDMAALKALYLETMVQSADFSDALAIRAIGRSPVHVLLLHETDLAGLYIGDLARALRADGWEIVTADIAYADPIRTAQPDVPWAAGTLTEALAWEKGIKGPRWYERNETKFAKALFDARVLHEEAK